MNAKFYKLLVYTLFLLVPHITLQAQNIKVSGKVFEKATLLPLQGVRVACYQNGKITAGTASNAKGIFEISINKPDTCLLVFSYLGLKTKNQTVIVNEDKYIGAVFLDKAEKSLKEVTIESTEIRVEQKGDTTSINANAFKVNPDATTEDLIKKMPGLTVENGTVKAQGEEVKKVLLDGKEFFGDDAQMALKNLPAEIVDKVQIFNRLGDQAQFTGFNDGNTDKTLNIVTKTGRNNGTFGKVFAGYGTDDRYQSGAVLNVFKGNRRITVLGIGNNINQQNFSMQDLFGSSADATRMRGGGGMGRGGMGGGGGPDMSNFFVGQQSGINITNSIGVNYADRWGTKTQVSGSYFFNNSNTTSNKSLQRHYLMNPENDQLYNEDYSSKTINFNNRFNLRLEHAFDTFNTLIFTPRVSFQNNDAFTSTYGTNYILNKLINSSETDKEVSNKGLSLNSNLLFRHKFLKVGRTISFNLGIDGNQKNNQTDQNSNNISIDSLGTQFPDAVNQRSITKTEGRTGSANITYTEPLSKTSQLLFSYSPSYTNNQADKLTHIFNNSTKEYDSINTYLSNKFDNTIITQKGNIAYNFNNEKNTFTVGFSPQRVELNSMQLFPVNLPFNKTFFNVLTHVTYSYKFTNSKTFRVIYRTNTNTPGITQMQNVVDNSNPFLLSAGNPNLKQENSHIALIRYGANRHENAQSFFIFAMANLTNNYIANATYSATKDTLIQNGVTLRKGSQLSYPVNLNGNLSMRTFITYGMPIALIKCNLNLNTGINYTSVPGLINYQTNYANTLNINGGFVLGSNISQQIDFTLSHNANVNLVKNTLQAQTSNNYFINTSGLKANFMFLKAFVLSSDLSYTHYRGLGSAFNQDFLLWNAAFAYKFLKNRAGEVRFSVFDIMKQNNSIARSVTETYIEDSRSNVLQAYFMLTFTYNIRKFTAMATTPPSPKPDENRKGNR
ncbi:MAG: outer membrane beta-barrel protein [Bacteroidota bacterium]|nr:outer membrane beta-barrel protein [Bacteroidota bacterium]